MGLKEMAIPMLLFCIAIFGIAQSGITINAYLTTNKPKDSSFKFSMAVMVFSVCLLFGSGFWAYKSFTGEGGAEEISPEEAAAAAASEKLGGLALPTIEKIAAVVPDIKGATNVETLRASEQQLKSAVEETKTQLDTLVESVSERIGAKEGALQKIKEAAALVETTT